MFTLLFHINLNNPHSVFDGFAVALAGADDGLDLVAAGVKAE